MMEISLGTIPKGQEHSCGYDTCGNWEFVRMLGVEMLEVTVSQMDDEDSEFAVAVHELIEAWLCRKNGVTEEQVCHHDRRFEAERAQGQHSEMAEPGDDPRAPYRKEHQAATLVEMLVLTLLGKSWPEHNSEVVK